MIQWIIELDRDLFLFFNTKFTNSFLDVIMPTLRHRNTWIPLYVIILFVVIWKMKWRCVPWIICLIFATAAADIISSHFFKPYFGRFRPCNELSPVYNEMILRLKKCSGHNSFTSSHAANHGAIASFIIMASTQYYRRFLWAFALWAIVICWAQIYVGVHYPLDILGGLIIGTFTAFISNRLYNSIKNKRIFNYGKSA